MTVYAVQQQMRFDQTSKKLVPRFTSISKAEQWGSIVYLLSPSAHPFSPSLVLGDLHEALCNFGDEDHLLLIGNPGLIGMATALAAHYNRGRVKLLQWSGRHNEYTEIITEIY
tara:strand:+ start:1700 stop:2038 length:339 start_codon:yes stop_codon:yes gene_type:complete